MKGTAVRFATGVGVVATLFGALALPASAAVPPTQAPVVSVSNPSPGAYLRRGGNWIFGEACDPNAATSDPSAGIASVSIFLGDRDTTVNVPSFRPGGYYGVASTVATTTDLNFVARSSGSRIGLPTPDGTLCKQANAGWRLRPVSFRKGRYDFNIYVLGKNGKETKVTLAGIRVDMP